MWLARARRLLSPKASGPCSGGMSRYFPQLARSSQPLRRSDSITWSAALGPPPRTLIISSRVASRRPLSLRPRTTRLSCCDKDRVAVSMSISFTKPPETGGFDENNSMRTRSRQQFNFTKPHVSGGFVHINIFTAHPSYSLFSSPHSGFQGRLPVAVLPHSWLGGPGRLLRRHRLRHSGLHLRASGYPFHSAYPNRLCGGL